MTRRDSTGTLITEEVQRECRSAEEWRRTTQ